MSLIWKYVCSVSICKGFSVSIALHESWLERVWNVAKNCLAQPKMWFNQYCQSQTAFNDYRKGIPSAVFWWKPEFWQQKISPSQMIPLDLYSGYFVWKGKDVEMKKEALKHRFYCCCLFESVIISSKNNLTKKKSTGI